MKRLAEQYDRLIWRADNLYCRSFLWRVVRVRKFHHGNTRFVITDGGIASTTGLLSS